MSIHRQTLDTGKTHPPLTNTAPTLTRYRFSRNGQDREPNHPNPVPSSEVEVSEVENARYVEYCPCTANHPKTTTAYSDTGKTPNPLTNTP